MSEKLIFNLRAKESLKDVTTYGKFVNKRLRFCGQRCCCNSESNIISLIEEEYRNVSKFATITHTL